VCGHTGKKRKRRKGKTKNICFYFSFCLLSNDLPVHPTTTFLVARFPTLPVAVATTATTPGGGSTEQTNRNNNNNKQTNKQTNTNKHATPSLPFFRTATLRHGQHNGCDLLSLQTCWPIQPHTGYILTGKKERK
jgi:hypothetical protein